jgi:hypothetical protein
MDTLPQTVGNPLAQLVVPPTRPRTWSLWLALLVTLLLGLGCDQFQRKPRRFGASCGVASECESGICYQGQCTKACQSGSDCGALGVCIENFCQAPDLDWDADTLTNGFEAKWGLKADSADSDGDGLPDADEVGFDPGNPADQNGDGIIDAAQSNILDKDADCIVDAFDAQQGQPDALPDPTILCNQGVCLGAAPGQITTKCVPPTTTPSVFDVAEGCAGCICEAQGVANWQATESWCDALDNDCDGKSDEDLLFDGLPIGSACLATQGICMFAPAGVVQCGSDKAVTCSTAATGSQSAAKTESCNGLDDDCDGSTDEDFTWQGQAIGTSCLSCGGDIKTCPDNTPANAPIVTCGLDGLSAVCSAVPFEGGFVRVGDGPPLPHRRWTAVAVPEWDQVLVYGGRVPTDSTRLVSDQFYRFALNTEAPVYWERLTPSVLPGPRAGAALVWDKEGDRVLLVGGRNATSLDTSVWAYDATSWTHVSESAGNDAIAALPIGAQQAGNESFRQSALGTVLQDGDDRALVVLDPRFLRAKVHQLGNGSGSWTEPTGDIAASQGASVCLVANADGSQAWALRTDGNLTHFAWSGGDITTDLAAPTTATDLPVEGAQCFVDGNGELHVLGGLTLAGEPFGHIQISLDGPSWSWTELAAAADLPPEVERSGGFALHLDVSEVVLGGGIVQTADGPKPADSVYRWDWGVDDLKRLDKPAPRGRIGHGAGFRASTNTVCVAGGLLFDLPELAKPGNGPLVDAPTLACRTVPATDAWCSTLDGQWTQLTDDLPPYAVGMAAIDGGGDKLVLAGGLQLSPGQHVPEVSRIWSGDVVDGGALLAQFLPTQQATVLDLATGGAQSVSIAGMPALAGPAQAWDPLRQRIILYGGWGESGETQTYASLDIGKRTWTDLTSKMTLPLGQKPQPRYGSLAFYHPVLDIFGLVAGSVRQYNNGLPGFKVQDLVSPDVAVAPVGCYANAHTALWLASVDKSFDQFQTQPLRKFGSVTASGPSNPFLVPWAGGPSFLPVLFDAVGSRAWLAVPTGPLQSTIAADSSICPTDVLQPGASPEVVNRQLSLVAGVCSGQQVLDMDNEPLQAIPDALLMSAGLYLNSARTSVVFGGLSAQRTTPAGLWRLQQTCTAP